MEIMHVGWSELKSFLIRMFNFLSSSTPSTEGSSVRIEDLIIDAKRFIVQILTIGSKHSTVGNKELGESQVSRGVQSMANWSQNQSFLFQGHREGKDNDQGFLLVVVVVVDAEVVEIDVVTDVLDAENRIGLGMIPYLTLFPLSSLLWKSFLSMLGQLSNQDISQCYSLRQICADSTDRIEH